MYYLRVLLGCIKRSDFEYNLINDGDKIAVGVSGGKDSMVLLNALMSYKRMVSKEKSFELYAIHVDLGFDDMNADKIKKYYEDNDIHFDVIKSDVYEILKLNKTKTGMLSCSICTKMRKAIIIDKAKELGCNKLALGHHADDAIETFFLNMIYGGRLASFRPKNYLDRRDITLIRPLIYAREKEIEKAFKKLELPLLKSTCPNDGYTKRQDMKDLINSIEEKYPSSRDNFLLMLHNKEKMELWEKERE